MRTALVVVSLLLAPAIASGVAPGLAPQPAATNDTSGEDAPINRIAHLTLGEGSEEGLTNQPVNVTSAVSIGRDDAAARVEDYATAERLTRTNETNATLERTLDDLEFRVERLEAEERTAGSQYASGSMSTARFVHEVAHLQARSERLRARLSRLEGAVDRYGNASHRDRIDRLRRRLIGNTGPVRDRALAAVVGTQGDLRLYAAGSEKGVVFATIDGSEYVRDAYRADRQQQPPKSISSNAEAFNRFQELYPVAFEFSGANTLQGVNGDETYLFLKQLSSVGSLLSYLDGNTRDVFYEVHRRQLPELNQPASVTATENGTRLVVNRSHVGGPLRVATYDADSENATARTIRVDDRRLDTGQDGIVWTLMPPKRQVEVTAVAPNGTVSVTAESIELTPVNSSG
jgi:hypothetical protein